MLGDVQDRNCPLMSQRLEGGMAGTSKNVPCMGHKCGWWVETADGFRACAVVPIALALLAQQPLAKSL